MNYNDIAIIASKSKGNNAKGYRSELFDWLK